jgi:methyl-accepting chemotaxis protein
MTHNHTKTFHKESLSGRILLWITLVLLLVFGSIGLYQYWSLSSLADAGYHSQAKQLFAFVEKNFQIVFDENIAKMDALAGSPAIQKVMAATSGPVPVAEASAALSATQRATPYCEGVALNWFGDPISVRTATGRLVTVVKGASIAHATEDVIGRDFSDREYSKEMAGGKDVWLSSPTISRVTGKPNVVLARAVKVDGQTKGYLIMSFLLEFFTQTFVDNVTIGTGHLTLIHESGAIMASPDKSLILKTDPGKEVTALVQNVLAGRPEFSAESGGSEMLYLIQKWQYHDSGTWYLTFARPKSEIYADVSASVNSMLITFVVVLVVLWLLVMTLLTGAVTRPVVRFSHRLAEIADGGGDLTQTIPISGKNEIGAMADQFNRFLAGLNTLIRGLKNDMRHVSEVTGRLEDNAGFLASAVVELASTTKAVAQHARNQKDQTQTAIANLSSMRKQSHSLTTLVEGMDSSLVQSSSAIEEMSANIRSVADQAQKNDEAGEALSGAMERGRGVVHGLQETIQVNAENSQHIQESVKVIMQISAQTNLLAMNAAIEAAHAGDAGQGFAVVANEIRKLADQSASSAKEIQAVVKQVAAGFEVILKASRATGQELETLRIEVEKVRNGSREIAHAMAEQRGANDNILETTEHLTRLSTEIKQSISEQNSAIESVSNGANVVADLSLQVATATGEESVALEETARRGEELQQLASDLNRITTQVLANFESFKTTQE